MKNSGCAFAIQKFFTSIFFSLFFLAGVMVIWIGMIAPILDVTLSMFWKATNCTIVSSEVVGDDTFRIDIQYDYEFDGNKYTGNQYSFFNFKTSGKAGKEKIAALFPPGGRTICYVNPDKPMESVLNRSMSWNILWGLLGLPFFLVGAGGLYFTWFGGRQKAKKTDSFDEQFDDFESEPSQPVIPLAAGVMVLDGGFEDQDLKEVAGPFTLKPNSTPLASFLVLLVFTLIWNGIVLGIASTRIADWMQGKWHWLPELIIVPFMLLGLLMVFAVLHAFLGLFNPVPTLTLSRSMIPLGGKASLSWMFNRPASSVRLLQVSLKGVEESRYVRGTSTYTDTSVFFEELLFETEDPSQINEGETEILIPGSTMHSFSGTNNKIKWQLVFRGEIARWPDIKFDFPFRVIPHE